MKNLFTILFSCLISSTIYCNDIVGQWQGSLKNGKKEIRIVFNITKLEENYITTMDSPDQGATNIPTTSTSFENQTLKVVIENFKIIYEGTINESGIIIGTFTQGKQVFPLDLTKNSDEKDIVKVNRPQEPTQPYPYHSEDVKFENTQAEITLAGTLTLPKSKGKFPVVVLISGSGAQDRDETLLGHKPFLVLSDHLTKNGIAVLRYDDRGTAESTGQFKSATSQDFATDVEAAVAYLKTRDEIDHSKIGLVGHSEGGLIAPIVASQSTDVAFIVLLAGPGIPGDSLLLMQQRLISEAGGTKKADLDKAEKDNKIALDIIVNSTDQKQLKKDLEKYITETVKNGSEDDIPEGMNKKQFIKLQVNQLSDPWLVNFLKFDPVPTLKLVKCPVLAINGEKDLQVPATVNLNGIKSALKESGNTDLTAIAFKNLNHLFQECETGSPDEYAKIEQTFAPEALSTISSWILERTK